jgi:hypothetical protein
MDFITNNLIEIGSYEDFYFSSDSIPAANDVISCFNTQNNEDYTMQIVNVDEVEGLFTAIRIE